MCPSAAEMTLDLHENTKSVSDRANPQCLVYNHDVSREVPLGPVLTADKNTDETKTSEGHGTR